MDKEAADRAAMEAADAREAALAEQMRAEAARDAAVSAQQDAEDARDAAVSAQQDAEDARDAAVTAQRDAERAKNRAEAELATAQRDLEAANRRAQTEEEARLAAEEARRQAEEQARQQAQTLEANQRAEKLLAAFPDTASASTSRVDISVPSANGLTFSQSDYAVRPISAAGLRGARLTRTRGGTQTSVVYTDIELSRSLIKTYAPTTDPTPLTFQLNAVPENARENFLRDEDAVEITNHGFRSSRRLNADGTPAVNSDGDPLDPLAKTGSSFTGSVHGISGTFQCSTDCTLTATYSSENRLDGLTISDVANVSFKPGSRTATTPSTATVSLCDTPRSRCAATDGDYIAFGYWLFEPSNVQGDYEFELFAFGPDLTATAPTVSAEYNGTAVGMYVEQNQVGTAEVTKKQGEFIADARLDYNTTDGLTGTIDSFQTTPTGGSGEPSTTGWVVELNAAGANVLERHGPDGAGTWTHQYTTDGSAVVGTFESELEEVLSIVGAFGARQ